MRIRFPPPMETDIEIELTGAKEWAFALAKNGFIRFQVQPAQLQPQRI